MTKNDSPVLLSIASTIAHADTTNNVPADLLFKGKPIDAVCFPIS